MDSNSVLFTVGGNGTAEVIHTTENGGKSTTCGWPMNNNWKLRVSHHRLLWGRCYHKCPRCTFPVTVQTDSRGKL